MPDKPKTQKKGSSILTRKLGPAPVWVWVAAAAGLYLAYRWYAGRNAAAAQTTTPAATDTSGTVPVGGGSVGGGGDTSGLGGGATSPPDTSGAFAAYSDLLAQLEGQNAQLLGGLLAGGGGVAGSTPPAALPAGAAPSTPFPSDTWGAPTTTSAPSGTDAFLKIAQTPVAASSPNFAVAAQTRTAAGATAGVPVPFGGVVSVRTLANGASLTTYASGRQVEQVPGKTAYVVRA